MSETTETTETAVQDVAAAANDVIKATNNITSGSVPSVPNKNIDFILDVALTVSVEVGRTKMSIQNLLQLGQGVVVELSKLAGEPLDIYVNERLIARGEAVIVNEKFGVRVTDIISQQERVNALG
ncbi:MAG: flagellar motor switch protein FliN [Deltaproteobacteria bacterium]|jgi:flagellar motor switch protein FliN/FliY|nr:flagellar motor switch protein FliN [Deltaproteobacteria bacterium]